VAKKFSGRSRKAPWVECRFMVPLVRDSDRRPPRRVAPIPGGYTNRSGRRVMDESFRYTVALPSGRVRFLRRLLRKVANSFDQECIYLVVGVHAELVDADASAGDLGEA
jgi:hypothetical protein